MNTIEISGMRGDASNQVWDICVGSVTIEEFLSGYGTVDEAIADYAEQYPAMFGQEPPVFYWREMNSEYSMAEMLKRYIDDRIDD